MYEGRNKVLDLLTYILQLTNLWRYAFNAIHCAKVQKQTLVVGTQHWKG